MKSEITGVLKNVGKNGDCLGFETDDEKEFYIDSLFEALVSKEYPWLTCSDLFGKKFKITFEMEE